MKDYIITDVEETLYRIQYQGSVNDDIIECFQYDESSSIDRDTDVMCASSNVLKHE